MSLSTTQYGYIIDPMVPFTDEKGKTIKDGFIRVFMAGTSTPVLTYRNYDGATNQEKIELDNSGRVKYNVIGSKGSLYKVVVYNILHSQENPLLTVDKIAVLGASINASGATIVTGLDSVTVQEENFLKATVEGTGVELAIDPTEVTSEVSTTADAVTAAPDYVVPLLEKTGTGDGKKISLANIFKFALDWISRLATTITSFASGDYFAVSNTTDGSRKMSKDTLLELTAQNALAGNVAPAFDPTKPNDGGGYAYYAGKDIVSYQGKVYLFIVNKTSGAWDSNYVEEYKDASSKLFNEKNRSITQDYYEDIFEGGENLTPLGTLSLAGVKFVDTYTPNRCYAGSSQTFYVRSYLVEKGKHYRIKNCRGTGTGLAAFAVVANKQLTEIGSAYYGNMYQNITDGASHSSNVTLQALDFTAEFDGVLSVTGSTAEQEVSVVESLSVKNKATLLDAKIDAEVGSLNNKIDAEISRSIGQDYTDDYREGSVVSASNTLSSAELKFVSSYTPNRCYASTSTKFYVRSYAVEKGKHYRIKNCRGTGGESGPFATITNEAVSSTGAGNYKTMSQNVTDGSSHDYFVTLSELDFVASENGYLNVSGNVSYDDVSLYNLDAISVKEKVETLSVKNNQWQGKKIVWLGTSVPFGVNATTSYAKVASERLGFNLVPAVVPGQAIHCAVDSESGLPYPIASGSTCLSKSEYDAARTAGLTNITIEEAPVTPWVPGGSYNDYYRAWDNVITQDNADSDLWVFDVVPNNLNFALDDWSNFNRASWVYFDGQPFSAHRSTFLGAVIYLMDKIYTLNPYARFVFVLGSTFDYDNGKMNFEKLESLGCAVVDVWKKVNRMGPSLQVIKSLNGTNNHPSTFAHQVLGNMLANELLLIN